MKTELKCIVAPTDTITFRFDEHDQIELVINCKRSNLYDDDYEELSVLVNIHDLKNIVDSLIP